MVSTAKILIKSWDDPTGYLRQFSVRRRPFVAGLYYYSVTGTFLEPMKKTRDTNQMLERVRIFCKVRLDSHWTVLMQEDCKQLLQVLDTNRSREYAKYVVGKWF